MNRSDVVIVGGGMVGFTLALALQREGLQVCVIDHMQSQPWQSSQYETRVCALNLASIRCFSALDAWHAIRSMRAQAFEKIHVWESQSRQIEFDGSEIIQPYLGYIVENQIINQCLKEKAISHGCEYIAPENIVSIDIDKRHATVRLNSRSINTPLIIGADGKQSFIRNSLNIACKQWPIKHHGLVATVALENSHQCTAWQKFLPSGPLAFLPLNNNRCSLVWSLPEKDCQRLLELDKSNFENTLEAAIDHRFGKIELLTKTFSFPLQSSHAAQYVKHRLCLVGDAAHTIHPLAGQGVNLGIMDSAVLAETILEAWIRRVDIGHIQILRRYERRRKSYNMLALQTMETLASWFSIRQGPLHWIRNTGLNMVQHNAPFKRLAMQVACGLHGDLPSLAQHYISKEV